MVALALLKKELLLDIIQRSVRLRPFLNFYPVFYISLGGLHGNRTGCYILLFFFVELAPVTTMRRKKSERLKIRLLYTQDSAHLFGILSPLLPPLLFINVFPTQWSAESDSFTKAKHFEQTPIDSNIF